MIDLEGILCYLAFVAEPLLTSESILSFMLMADDLDVIGLLLVLLKYLFAKYSFYFLSILLNSSIPFLKSKSG